MKAPFRSTRSYMLQGLVLTILLVTVKILTEHTSVGHHIELFTFDLLRTVTPVSQSEELPVVVVDTSGVEGKNEQIIDLAKLKELTAAAVEQKPRAVGIALLLNPKERGAEGGDNSARPTEQQTREYYDFLDFCLKLEAEKNIPIFLTVGKHESEGQPKDWLGQERYRELAATAVVYGDEDAARIPVWLKAGPDADRLFSLSAALARAYAKPRLANGIAWAIETTGDGLPAAQQHPEAHVEYADAPVNYGKLDDIRQGRLFARSAASVEEAGERLRHKMVLLGDDTFEAATAAEVFTPPGRSEQFPSVYMHACAAHTFAREPLYEIKPVVRVALDLCLALLAFGGFAFVQRRRRGYFATTRAAPWGRVVVVSIAVAASLVAAIIFVYWLRLLWFDFVLVGVAWWLLTVFEKALRRLPELQHVLADNRPVANKSGPASSDKSRVLNRALYFEQDDVTPGVRTVRAMNSHKKKILFIAANPSDASRIQTDREHRIIKAEMERGSHRDKFEFLQPQFAATITELLRAMNERPNIVHFSGHGSQEGILITGDDNQKRLLTADVLERLFKPLKDCTEIVVLNSCYSAMQAETISKLGMYVIGNNLPVGDGAAISFAKGLYNGLSEGKSLEAAVNDARIVIMTEARSFSAVVEVWAGGRKLDI